MEIVINLEIALKHGLTEQEYGRIVEILGRVPTYSELGIFSVMWSEHCSYKNSIAELKKLPRDGDRLLVMAGEENAGLVDIGNGLAVAFKIESHNHPSAVEPYQGAATGVGGIMRDIFTMGARPIAALNSLRFGNLDNTQTKYLLKGVVKGIGDYGNSFGVPTVAGEIYFDDCYNQNPLVNAMAVGIVKHSHIAKAVAKGRGNIVMIAGSSTGRDGIHGATFASEEISEASENKRPSVQVGDPFTEKLLLEATLEVIHAGLVVGIQDMGAAGITCSISEMSARGKSGMKIDLDKVPVREDEMSDYEILLSESQERMLIVTSPENEENVKRIFGKWDLQCTAIGQVTDDEKLKVVHKGELIADIPTECLVLGGGAPVYYRKSKVPEYLKELREYDFESLPEPTDYNACFLDILISPNICSRQWVSTQYDSMVRTNTLVNMVGDAAIIRIKDTTKAIVLKTDCNSRYVYLNPYRGAQIAVAEGARNVVSMGAKPIAITNCLNFGNPYKEEIFWQFKEVIRGIGDACRALNTPVTGGNVSFYNESPEGPIFPTPVIGMLGEVQNYRNIVSADFKSVGDLIVLLGTTTGHFGGSEYLKVHHGLVRGDAPSLDIEQELSLHNACLQMVDDHLLSSLHDVSEGGIAIALAECSIWASEKNRRLGIKVGIPAGIRTDSFLFGEDQSRMVATVAKDKSLEVLKILDDHGVPSSVIGEVVSKVFIIGNSVNLTVEEIGIAYRDALWQRVGQ